MKVVKTNYGNDKISLHPNQTVKVVRWYRYKGSHRPSYRYVYFKVVSVDYKNPRARIKMVGLNGKKEYLVYPKYIIGY